MLLVRVRQPLGGTNEEVATLSINLMNLTVHPYLLSLYGG